MTDNRQPKTAHPGKKPLHVAGVDGLKTGYCIRGRIWIEKDGELYLGGGRVMLLERITETGSISAAARLMKLSYRNAWLWIESMNRLSQMPLVVKTVGGSRGNAVLTEEGRRAIAFYHELTSNLNAVVDKASESEIP